MRKLAEAKAYEVQKVNESASGAETYLRLRQLEAEMARWQRWDGRYPQYMLQLGGGTSSPFVMMPPLPAPVTQDAVKTVRTEKK